jgi:hypothetical protein
VAARAQARRKAVKRREEKREVVMPGYSKRAKVFPEYV